MPNIDTTAQILAAGRLRKRIYWARVRREPIPDAAVESIIRCEVWRQWGYKRLVDALTQDVGLAIDRAANWTCKAIEWGCEDAGLYGV